VFTVVNKGGAAAGGYLAANNATRCSSTSSQSTVRGSRSMGTCVSGTKPKRSMMATLSPVASATSRIAAQFGDQFLEGRLLLGRQLELPQVQQLPQHSRLGIAAVTFADIGGQQGLCRADVAQGDLTPAGHGQHAGMLVAVDAVFLRDTGDGRRWVVVDGHHRHAGRDGHRQRARQTGIAWGRCSGHGC